MRNSFISRVKPYLKLMKIDLLYYFFRRHFFIDKTAVAVEKDLATLLPQADMDRAGLRLVAITRDRLSPDGKGDALLYPPGGNAENREAKAAVYLNRGYEGFALARGSRVCGDIWYIAGDGQGPVHPDMEWLRIRCGSEEVYAFDMHVYPEQRGHNLAVLLQNGALHELKRKGYARAYGYYWADYIPALWVHRTLRWKEVSRIKVSRFFFIYLRTYTPVRQAAKPSVPGIA